MNANLIAARKNGRREAPGGDRGKCDARAHLGTCSNCLEGTCTICLDLRAYRFMLDRQS
jgi:hypothetical protein